MLTLKLATGTLMYPQTNFVGLVAAHPRAPQVKPRLTRQLKREEGGLWRKETKTTKKEKGGKFQGEEEQGKQVKIQRGVKFDTTREYLRRALVFQRVYRKGLALTHLPKCRQGDNPWVLHLCQHPSCPLT